MGLATHHVFSLGPGRASREGAEVHLEKAGTERESGPHTLLGCPFEVFLAFRGEVASKSRRRHSSILN
jgi:hypothetical protein